MALTKCKECGHQVSSKANACPHCGAKVKQPTNIFTAIAVIGIGFIAVTVIGGLYAPSSSPRAELDKPTVSGPPNPRPATEAEALATAKEFVKDSLMSPSTASFGGFLEQNSRDNVAPRPDGSFIVRLWVDSQNGFGATVRTDFVVELRRRDIGGWVLTEPLQGQQR